MSDRTDQTVVNPYKDKQDDRTQVNKVPVGSQAGPDNIFSLEKGSIIPDGYTVLERMGNSFIGGEADLFICEKDGKKYVARFLRREADEKDELIEKLKKIDSPYVAKIVQSGKLYERYYEIYEYFEKGSLADTLKERTFSMEELESRYIPELNEALHTLHKEGILHRDIKPANMMWSNEEDGRLVLIDFGLSAVTMHSHSIVVSQLGFTASYAAPEVLRNVYFDESDYYSLGIVLYEMFMGKTPFGDDHSYTSVISKPGKMPERLYHLILGLTYPDISYRHDPSNPNRRWTYENVCKWLSGNILPIPGQSMPGKTEEENTGAITPIFFCDGQYGDIDSLVYAMGLNWQEGKRLIFNGLLAGHLRSAKDASEAQQYYASVVEGLISIGKMNSDTRMTKILYTLSPDSRVIFTSMGVFEEVKQWGEAMLHALSTGAGDSVTNPVESIETVLLAKVFSEYRKDLLSDDGESRNGKESTADLILEFEKRVTEHGWQREREAFVYEFLYRLTGEEKLNPGLPDGAVFRTVEELKEYIRTHRGDGYKDLYAVTACLLTDEHHLKPAVYGWLKSKGAVLPGFNQVD